MNLTKEHLIRLHSVVAETLEALGNDVSREPLDDATYRSLSKGVGWTDRDERIYQHILQQAKESGRYGDRAEEVAARTVNKLRSRRKRLVMRKLKKDEDGDNSLNFSSDRALM